MDLEGTVLIRRLIDGFIILCHRGNEDLWQTWIKCVTVIELQKFTPFSPSPPPLSFSAIMSHKVGSVLLFPLPSTMLRHALGPQEWGQAAME